MNINRTRVRFLCGLAKLPCDGMSAEENLCGLIYFRCLDFLRRVDYNYKKKVLERSELLTQHPPPPPSALCKLCGPHLGGWATSWTTEEELDVWPT